MDHVKLLISNHLHEVKKNTLKYYPKKYQDSITIDREGYPSYRRRCFDLYLEKNGVKLDNRSVIPYNSLSLTRYQGHINIEHLNKSNLIKYLFKYVNKGPDLAITEINSSTKEDSYVVDEIKRYYNCIYLSSCEASWRIFAFDIHERWSPVQRLTFHIS